MNRFGKVLALGISTALASFALSAAPPQVSALTGDPVVTVTAPASVQVGQPITFDLTISQPGFAPTNGAQKIMYLKAFGGWGNEANYTVIPMTYDGTVWHFTYVATAAEVGRTFAFSETVPVSTARIPRTVTGTAYFTVVAA